MNIYIHIQRSWSLTEKKKRNLMNIYIYTKKLVAYKEDEPNESMQRSWSLIEKKKNLMNLYKREVGPLQRRRIGS